VKEFIISSAEYVERIWEQERRLRRGKDQKRGKTNRQNLAFFTCGFFAHLRIRLNRYHIVAGHDLGLGGGVTFY